MPHQILTSAKSTMLKEYKDHVEERLQQGIPPLPLNAEQVADLVELLKSPPAGEEAVSYTHLTLPTKA